MAKIMIVDDALFVRETIKTMLKDTEHEIVAEATTGDIAVEKYKSTRPDIVTMDITMDGMNGLDATKYIREFNSNAKIIMLSSMGQQDHIMEAIQNGACNFIIKPFTKEKLIQVIEKSLK